MFEFHLPNELWDEAFLYAVYVINRLPTKVLHGISPYYRLYGIHPDYSRMRIFGCLCYAHVDSSLRNTFAAHSIPCIFVGYSADQEGYRCLNPENGKILISRHVTFDETRFFFTQSMADRREFLTREGICY